MSLHAASELTPPPQGHRVVEFSSANGEMRDEVLAAIHSMGVNGEIATDAMIATHEIAANSVRHGGRGGRILIWVTAAQLIWQVEGAGIVPAAVLRPSRPTPEQESGTGLWLVSQLCDDAEFAPSPQDGTIIRMYRRLHA